MVAFIAIEKAQKLLNRNPGKFGERIARLETDMKNVKEDINEIKNGLKK